MRDVLKLNTVEASFCEADDSGRGPRPHSRSNVKPENRIWFHTHDTSATYLSGIHLKTLSMNFQHYLHSRLAALDIDLQRSDKTDLYSFIYDIVFPTQIEVLFGTSFLAMNTGFASDFREFHRGLPYLLQGYPRWLIPKAWDAWESCLKAIKRWHISQRKQKAESVSQSVKEKHSLYGSDFIKNRERMHAKMMPLDADAIASSELGVIWAANSNIITATFWYIVELCKDPGLLLKIRAEIVISRSSDPRDTGSDIDIHKLSTQPFIQSAYAEILRLRAYNFLVTTSEHGDFQFRDWTFPKDKKVAISSYTAHMDARIWKTSSGNAEHPLDEFWAERFLIHPPSSLSGPLKPEYSSNRRSIQQRRIRDQYQDEAHDDSPTSSEGPQFSLAGLSGIWVPFGGGHSLCPGRHLAKEEILLSIAVISTAFEFEIVEKDTVWSRLVTSNKKRANGTILDMRYFGMGILPSTDKVHVRFRRRQEEKA